MKRPSALVFVLGMLLLAGCAQKSAASASGSGTPVVVVTKTVVVTVLPSESPPSSLASGTSPALGKGEWAAVAVGSYDTLALKRDGTLWAWGLNDYGQLGQGTYDVVAHPSPHQVGHDHDWAALSAGDGNSLALRADGTLWGWGNNSDLGGNLGLGLGTVTGNGYTFYPDRWSPTRVGHDHDWAALFCGYQHALAMKTAGTLWGWGANWYGALGRSGSGSLVVAPAEVSRDADWATAAGGGDFSLAVKKDGGLWASGLNVYGELGLGDTADRRSLAEVGRAHDWETVSAGIAYSLALKKDGSLWAWGDNSFGELGLGDTTTRHSPTQVGSANDWAAVYCLGHHSVAIRKDGTLWAWGENGYGQLGLGDTTDRHSPTQVGISHDWVSIAPGSADSYHTVALKRDGTLWAWGFNRFGQLGLGDTTDRHTPTQVAAR